MKRLFAILLLTTLLTACNSSELSIREMENVPQKVQDMINSDDTLQMINSDEKHAYIIFRSTGTATADLEVVENILNIKLATENQEGHDLKEYVYKLTYGDSEHDTIDVLVNGQSTPFDTRTIY